MLGMVGPSRMGRMTMAEDDFWMEKLYPKAAARLDWQPRSLDEIKGNCIVCVDTTFLFYCLELSERTLVDQFKAADRLSSTARLFVPIHVIREFTDSKHLHQSRLTDKLKGHIKRLRDAEDILRDETFGTLKEELQQRFLDSIKQTRTSLGDLRSKLESGSDVTRLIADRCNRMAEHFQASIYDPEFSSDDNSAIARDHELRLAHKRGPGFEDSDKSDRGIGDLNRLEDRAKIG
jgi:hypothetical protein